MGLTDYLLCDKLNPTEIKRKVRIRSFYWENALMYTAQYIFVISDDIDLLNKLTFGQQHIAILCFLTEDLCPQVTKSNLSEKNTQGVGTPIAFLFCFIFFVIPEAAGYRESRVKP